jgi:predicted nucleic acid-binding protein
MHLLIDTNLLVRSVQRSSNASNTARSALLSLYRGEHRLFLTPQNLAEFWNVCTRPQNANGLGLTVQEAHRRTYRLERVFTVLPDSLLTFHIWRDLVVKYEVKGAKVHDARLVATMMANRIPQIVTFNTSDFTRYSGIEAVHPENLSASSPGQ